MIYSIKRTKTTGLLLIVVFLLLLSVPAVAGQTFFEDDFSGDSLDAELWNTDHATDGKRWCSSTVTPHHSNPGIWLDPETQSCHYRLQSAPFGSVQVNDGVASFAAGYVRTFPYIWAGEPSRLSPFPSEGDFTLEIRMKYDSIRGHGDGIQVLYWENSDPEGNNPPLAAGKRLLGMWADSSGNSIGLLNKGKRLTHNPYAFHVYRVEFADGYYSLYVDDSLVFGPLASALRPNTIWIGNPVFTFWGIGDWSDFSIDYIKVTVPKIDVPVDIKPQSCPNPLNVKSNGVLPVAIVGSADLDVTQIDPASVSLAGVAPLRFDIEDVTAPFEPYTGKTSATDCNADGADGHADLTLKYDRQTVLDAIGSVQDGEAVVLELTGTLNDGTPIKGEDVVLIRKKGK